MNKGPEEVNKDARDPRDHEIAELRAQVRDLTEALLAGADMDATVRNMLQKQKRKIVQFLRGYSCAGKVSPLNSKVFLVRPYKMAVGDVALLPENEIARLKELELKWKRPTIETDQKKFKEKEIWQLVIDKKLQRRVSKKVDAIKVKELIKMASDIG